MVMEAGQLQLGECEAGSLPLAEQLTNAVKLTFLGYIIFGSLT